MKKIMPIFLIFSGLIFVLASTVFFVFDSSQFYTQHWPESMMWKAFCIAAIIDVGGLAMSLYMVVFNRKTVPCLFIVAVICHVVYTSSAGQVNPILDNSKAKTEYNQIISSLQDSIAEKTEDIKTANKKDRININWLKRKRSEAREDLKYYQDQKLRARNELHDRFSVLGLISVRVIGYPLIVFLLHAIGTYIKETYYGAKKLSKVPLQRQKRLEIVPTDSMQVAGFTNKVTSCNTKKPDGYEQKVIDIWREKRTYAAICQYFGKGRGGKQNSQFKAILKRWGEI